MEENQKSKIISAEHYKDLHDRIKSELWRRGIQSFISYAKDESPQKGKIVNLSHINKIKEGLKKLQEKNNTDGIDNNIFNTNIRIIYSLDSIDDYISRLEETEHDASSPFGCSGSCLGLCSGNCDGECEMGNHGGVTTCTDCTYVCAGGGQGPDEGGGGGGEDNYCPGTCQATVGMGDEGAQ